VSVGPDPEGGTEAPPRAVITAAALMRFLSLATYAAFLVLLIPVLRSALSGLQGALVIALIALGIAVPFWFLARYERRLSDGLRALDPWSRERSVGLSWLLTLLGVAGTLAAYWSGNSLKAAVVLLVGVLPPAGILRMLHRDRGAFLPKPPAGRRPGAAPLRPVGATGPAKGALLSVRDLRGEFDTPDGVVKPMDGISFDIHRGEVFAVVGESGSGKSVTALAIMGLLPTLEITGGEILWKGEDLLGLDDEERRKIRGGEIAMIFQDPLSALNPVHRVGRQIAEMATIHQKIPKRLAEERAVEMLDLVGIPEARKRADMYPHEFSGGMRQRAMIAMAITNKPDLLIADEPTTALDVTVQAQVLQVLVDIKDEIDSAIMIITHDLGVVAGLADNVMVMYAGRQAEMGTTDEIFYKSRHPYTLGLLASMPRLDDHGDEPLIPIIGSPPSLIHRPPGCPFHPRCRFANFDVCRNVVPELFVVSGRHRSACHRIDILEGVTVEDLRSHVTEAELMAEASVLPVEGDALADDEATVDT
jgi:oligopeptide/dipeptide ABC transporter ATP-binding protein